MGSWVPYGTQGAPCLDSSDNVEQPVGTTACHPDDSAEQPVGMTASHLESQSIRICPMLPKKANIIAKLGSGGSHESELDKLGGMF